MFFFNSVHEKITHFLKNKLLCSDTTTDMPFLWLDIKNEVVNIGEMIADQAIC